MAAYSYESQQEMSIEPPHEQAPLTNVKLVHHQMGPGGHPHHPAIHQPATGQAALIRASRTAQSHNGGLMSAPIMSLASVNFPVAFFNITEHWEFALLIAVCFVFSLLVEFARVRNLIGSLIVKRPRKTPVIKRYKPIIDLSEQEKSFDVRKPSFSSDLEAEGAKQHATSDDAKSAGAQSRKHLYRKQHQVVKRNNNCDIGLTDFCNVPDHHVYERPPPGGLLYRMLQFIHNFAMIFFSYALMMAAMSNFWVLLSICFGAAIGHLFGALTNDYQAARLYNCSNKSSVHDGEVITGKVTVPDIKIETHDDDSEDEDDVVKATDIPELPGVATNHYYCKVPTTNVDEEAKNQDETYPTNQ